MEKNNQLADPTSAIDGKHIYINSAANNTLDGSETFQGDVNFNNHRIKKCTYTSFQLWCRQQIILWNNVSQIDKWWSIIENIKWRSEERYHSQKNWHVDNLFLQIVKSRLLNPDYDSDDSLPQDVMNKKHIDSKIFPIDKSKGLDMKGNKIINFVDPTNPTDTSNKRYVDTKTNTFFNNWWFEINDWWFQYD